MKLKTVNTRFIFTFSLLLLVTAACNSPLNSRISTASYRTRLLDSLLESAVKNSEIPGAVAFLTRNGEEVYHKAFGMSDIEKNIAMKEDDIFRLASMTKAVTAVGVLLLCERGLLFLDDEIGKYIPEFKDPRILIEILPDSSFTSSPAQGEITIRQLLTHTSGIGYGFQDRRYNALVRHNKVSEGFGRDTRTSLDNTRKIAKLPLLFEPGQEYRYSMSYDVLGTLIEVVSGMRYDKYIQHFILDPLGMNNSYFIIPPEEQDRLVTVYQPGGEGPGFTAASYLGTNYPLIETKQSFSGGSDLCGTAEDYAKFVQMVLNKGVYNNSRIIGERYIEMMLSKQTPFDDEYSDQGFSAWITNSKGAAIGPKNAGAFGFGGFFDTYSWADPEGNFVAVLLLQMFPTNQYAIHEKFQSITYGIIEDL